MVCVCGVCGVCGVCVCGVCVCGVCVCGVRECVCVCGVHVHVCVCVCKATIHYAKWLKRYKTQKWECYDQVPCPSYIHVQGLLYLSQLSLVLLQSWDTFTCRSSSIFPLSH